MPQIIAIFLIKLYQKLLSPVTKALGAECRFYPSCSEYALESFSKLPFWTAFFYTAKRLLKCGPWHHGGIDKVKVQE